MSADGPVQNVAFPSNGNEAHGYLAIPPGGHGPGLIVIQEWWGLTTHIAAMTDRFAEAGFVALAPDLFGGKTTHDAEEAGRLMQALPVDRAVTELSGALDFLLGLDATTGTRIGAVGFCMGGTFVLRLASRAGDRLAAAVAVYPVLAEIPDVSGVRAAVQAHFGADDDFLPDDGVEQLEARLTSATGSPPELHRYPAGHAFMNDENLLGTYDPEQTRIAWERMVEFLHAQLD